MESEQTQHAAAPGPVTPDGGDEPVEGQADTVLPTARTPVTGQADTAMQAEDTWADGSRGSAFTPLAPGTIVNGLVIRSAIGAGGMGIVYAAHDMELGRKVALKVIRGELGWSPEARTRLLREAQALARLSHPNVVAVHRMGSHEDHVWIAMEYVHGQTLRRWREAEPRTWRALVEVVRAAGRGLAKAHEAGLLHRDIKPDNIMVSDDGRVRLMDFGLARTWEDDEDGRPQMSHARMVRSALHTDLTQFGAILGTPGYVAPEQLRDVEVDARADQFALAATLWEALYGARPFAGQTFEGYTANVLGGVLVEPADDRGVPPWVRRAVARGLAVDPDERYPDTAAFVAALRRDPNRRRDTAMVLGGVGLAVAGSLVLSHTERARLSARCHAPDPALAEAWGDGGAERVRAALLATGLSFAEGSADHVIPALDAYVARWHEMRATACLASEVEERWDATLTAAADACLDERRRRALALIKLLQDPGEGERGLSTVRSAVGAATRLPVLDPCVDEFRLADHPMPPDDPELRAVIDEVRALVSGSAIFIAAGRFPDGLALTEEAIELADRTGWKPLRARAMLANGSLLMGTEQHERAEQALHTALVLAAESRETEIAILAAQKLSTVVGVSLLQVEAGRRWLRIAEMLMNRAEVSADDLRRVHNRRLGADIDFQIGELERARATYRAIEPRLTEAFGEGHPEVLDILFNAAASSFMLDEFDEAEVMMERVLALTESTYGPDHPNTADGLTNLSGVYAERGEPERSMAMMERALAIYDAAYGPGSEGAAIVLVNMATNLDILGDYRGALESATRALEYDRARLGDQHPSVAVTRIAVADILWSLGEVDPAREHYEGALEVIERGLGDHPDLIPALSGLAAWNKAVGNLDEARALSERALTIAEQFIGPESSVASAMMSELADVHARAGDLKTALDLGARAVEIAERELPLDVVQALMFLAEFQRQSGALEQAASSFERAVELCEKKLGADSPILVTLLSGLALTRVEQRAPERAIPLAERAVELHERDGGDPLGSGYAHLALARALSTTPGGRARADEHAARVEALVAAHGQRASDLAADLAAWRDAQ